MDDIPCSNSLVYDGEIKFSGQRERKGVGDEDHAPYTLHPSSPSF